MRVQPTLLITTDWEFADEPTSLQRYQDLDRLIDWIFASGRTPYLVIGADGDNILRYSRRAERCELVFDPNYEGEIFSSVKAGLCATEGSTFVWLASLGLPEQNTWKSLEENLGLSREPNPDVLRPLAAPSYPRLVTLTGLKKLRTLPAQTNWDTTASVQHQDVEIQQAPTQSEGSYGEKDQSA